MINQLKPLNILLSLATITVLIPSYTQSVNAQYQSTEDNPGYQSNEKDSLYGEGISGINPMELIHRANLSNGRSLEEFNQESAGQIQDSASTFKLLQQQRILEQYRQQQVESESPADPIAE